MYYENSKVVEFYFFKKGNAETNARFRGFKFLIPSFSVRIARTGRMSQGMQKTPFT